MKKFLIGIFTGAILIFLTFTIINRSMKGDELMISKEYLELPLARYNDSDCENNYSVACSMIAAENLIDFLDRDNVAYIDIRNYDEAQEKRLKGFSVVPFLDLIYSAENDGQHLYTGSINQPIAVFENSDELLHKLIPLDQPVFLLCKSGRRVSQLMMLLESLGYNMDLIYNVGGVDHYTLPMYDDLWIKNSKVDPIEIEKMK